MNRLNQLIKHHKSGSINESDYHELVELLLKQNELLKTANIKLHRVVN